MALKFLISVLTIKGHPFSTYAIFRKTNISFLLLHTHTCTYHGIRNVSFSEHFAYLLNPICPRKRGTHCAPPVGILTAVFSPVALWSSFYMTFSLILYWKCNQQNFFDQSNDLLTPACLSVIVNDCRLLWNCRFITTPL